MKNMTLVMHWLRTLKSGSGGGGYKLIDDVNNLIIRCKKKSISIGGSRQGMYDIGMKFA